MIGRWCAFLAVTVAVSGCATSRPSVSRPGAPGFDPASTARMFFSAWDRRDEAAVRKLLADDAQWKIHGQTYSGRDDVIRFLQFEAAQGGRFALERTENRADTLLFETVESSDFMAALGVRSVRNFGRMVFARGTILRIDEARPPEGREPLGEALGPFAAWIQARHPEALPGLFTPEGRPIISAASGRTLLDLAREWKGQSRGR